jgi:hypothetical protein
VILKNLESTFDKALSAVLKPHLRLVISGDVRQAKINIVPDDFGTVIGFSGFPDGWDMPSDPWPKYLGIKKEKTGLKCPVIVAENIE